MTAERVTSCLITAQNGAYLLEWTDDELGPGCGRDAPESDRFIAHRTLRGAKREAVEWFEVTEWDHDPGSTTWWGSRRVES